MLSLSMIMRDEAGRLERCLASVAGFVDEMVIVDTGSQDDSVAIAERFGATVHRLAWPGDFAPARNHALERTHGDWVLVLDADEWLRREVRPVLRELMADPAALLITVLRREIGARQSPYSSVSRLFRRHGAIRWSGRYHALVDDSVIALRRREPHWRVLHCPEPALLHDGYRPQELSARAKAARLRQAMEAELEENPGDPYSSAKLAGLELREGRRDRALHLLQQGLARCPTDAHAERFELLLPLAMAHAATDPGRAIGLCRQALGLPLDPRLTLAARLQLADLLQRQGDTESALRLCREVTSLEPGFPQGWFQLGLLARQSGELAVAIDAYRRVLELEPDHAEAHQNLAVALLLGGNLPGARQGLRTAITLLRQQGRPAEAEDLRRRVKGIVTLDD